MDSDTLIRELETRASELEEEARRLRSASEVLQGKRAATDTSHVTGAASVRKVSQTNPTILKVLNESGPMDARTLTTAMLDRGWETTSITPSNTVRTALGRLADRGEVVRLDDGQFATMRWIEDNARDE